MNKISIDATGMLTEYMRTDSADITQRWFRRNCNDFDREELVAILDEILSSMIVNRTEHVLEDAAIEIDDKYDELYQKGE